MRTLHRSSSRLLTAAVVGAAASLVGILGVSAEPANLDSADSELIEELAVAASKLDTTPTVRVAANGQVVSLAELVDLSGIAEVRGISLRTAISRYAWQDEFNEVASILEGEFPEEYAGASSAYYGPWIAFKGDVPRAAHRYVEELPVSVDLIPGKGFSKAELKNALEDAYYDVFSRPDIADATGGFDIETGQITVEALPTEVAVGELERERLEAQVRPSEPENPRIRMEVLIVDRLDADSDSHLFGGGLITGCTAGFAVIHTGGTSGIATADHCAVNRPSVTYDNHFGGGEITLSRQGRSGTGDNGDLAWYANTSHPATDDAWFYYDWNTIRQVTAVSTAQISNTVCNFGRNTGGGGDKCSIVALLDACRSGYCGMTVTVAYINGDGDSIGPWYLGGTAYGIHSGRLCVASLCGSAFTPVQGNLFQSMGVLVMQA